MEWRRISRKNGWKKKDEEKHQEKKMIKTFPKKMSKQYFSNSLLTMWSTYNFNWRKKIWINLRKSKKD